MPRGKLHYEAFEVDGMLVEHWKDSHGNDHIEESYLDDDYDMPKTMKELRAEVRRLLQENKELKQQINELKSR